MVQAGLKFPVTLLCWPPAVLGVQACAATPSYFELFFFNFLSLCTKGDPARLFSKNGSRTADSFWTSHEWQLLSDCSRCVSVTSGEMLVPLLLIVEDLEESIAFVLLE